MTTPTQVAEADRVELVYKWALTQLGTQTIADSLQIWQDVPATTDAAHSSGWLSNAVNLVMLRRGLGRNLAIAYYRLIRALRTGNTIKDPRRAEQQTTLEALRQQFEDAIDAIAPPDTPGEPKLNPDHDDNKISVEDSSDINALVEKLDRAAEQEASLVLDQLGVENMLKKLDDIDDEVTKAEADKAADLAHQDAGARQAAAAARIAMNGGRVLVHELMDEDKRAVGYVRVSTTGNPCGWCAMLISRQVFYKSQAAARPNPENIPGLQSADNQYHDNDYCIAVPVFSQEQYDRSPLFSLNREMSSLWNSEIKGKYSGDAALTRWRQIIRSRKSDAALEAA